MNLLAIETATTNCSVAVLSGQSVICETNLNKAKAHAQDLGELVQFTLKKASITPTDLNAIAVSKGPGSYTGLRIGVSTAKGLAFAWGLPLIGVPTFEGLAINLSSMIAEQEILCTVFDARRTDVYCAAFYKREGEIQVWRDTTMQPAILLHDWLQTDKLVYFAGNAAIRCQQNFEDLSASPTKLIAPDVYLPNAGGIARAALKRYEFSQFEELESFEPFYLNEFIAQHPAKNPFDKIG